MVPKGGLKPPRVSPFPRCHPPYTIPRRAAISRPDQPFRDGLVHGPFTLDGPAYDTFPDQVAAGSAGTSLCRRTRDKVLQEFSVEESLVGLPDLPRLQRRFLELD